MDHGRVFDNYTSPLIVLERLNGAGYLNGDEISQECNFSVARLLNGRLRVEVVVKDWPYEFDRVDTFEIMGVDEQGMQVTIKEVHFTLSKSNPPREVRLGYARSFTRLVNGETISKEVISIRCDVVNYSIFSSYGPVPIKIAAFDLEIDPLHWEEKWEIREHSFAYQHATIQTCLRIENIPLKKRDDAIECLRNVVQLLSIARRGHVFTVAKHISQGDLLLESYFEEPPFTDRHWPRPLIHDKEIPIFLQSTFPNLVSKYQEYELSTVLDHYFQALAIRSAWPLSLGIFTAMETLKAAFIRQDGDAHSEFWVKSQDDFNNNKDLFNDLISVLCNHYPRFCNLTKSEKDGLNAQLTNLNRRSYRTQLRNMFSKLGVSYNRQELQSFINIRNSIIHEGAPVKSSFSSSEYAHGMTQGWKQVERAVTLFEKTLLALLNYNGPKELFDTTRRYD